MNKSLLNRPRVLRMPEFRPCIFESVNDVVTLTTDYQFNLPSATSFESDVLVNNGVEMKSTSFVSDVPLGSANTFDKLVANEIKKQSKNDKL